MDVVLVGLPGSGKSVVGRRLAHRQRRAFIDLDERIERAAGRADPGDLRGATARPASGPASGRRSPTSGRPTRTRGPAG